jgi:hypothetical protein
MKRIIGQAIILGTLVAVPAAALARPTTDASPLDDKKDDKKAKDSKKKKAPAPAPSSSHSTH